MLGVSLLPTFFYESHFEVKAILNNPLIVFLSYLGYLNKLKLYGSD
jgi:hypothetical protein